MEFRKIFDTIPEQFDKFRPRYSQELFDSLIDYAKIGPSKKVLEIGPGTGQATEPILNTGCDYNAIELGEHLYAKMKEKYGDRPNFNIVNDDFITHDFSDMLGTGGPNSTGSTGSATDTTTSSHKFDLIYSAATIQWIPEDIAFSKTFELLAPGGTLAMFLTKSEYKSTNPTLHDDIQKIYDAYFKPETPYPHRSFHYQNATNYGYVDFEERDFHGKREMTADEYVAFSGTHCDHMVIAEPYKTKFFEGLHKAVLAHDNKIIFNDTYVMYLTKKPASL